MWNPVSILDPEQARQIALGLCSGAGVGTVLLALTLPVLRLSRRAAAGLRHQLLLSSLFSLFLLPFVAASILDFAAPALSERQGLADHGFGAAAKFADMRLRRPASGEALSAGIGWVLFLAAWWGGAAVMLLGLARRLLSLGALRRGCRTVKERDWQEALNRVRAELGIRAPVRLLAHPEIRSPMVWGPPRAFVLVPETMARRGASAVGARLTLLHELAHLERRDSLWKLTADVVCALNWFNPLAWMARRRLDEAQEMAADSRVLEEGVRPSTYSSHLLALFRTRAEARDAELRDAPGLSSMAGVGSFSGRIAAILERGRNHGRPPRWIGSLIGASFAVPLAALVAFAQDSSTGEPAHDRDSIHAVLNPVFANKMADLRIAGAAVSVVRDGELVYHHGFGQAEVFEPRPVVSDRTVFRIGSVTKVVTAIAVMQCVDRGLLDLEADVNRYLKSFQVDDTYPEPVRVKHLLTHTAGFDQLGVGRHVRTQDEVLPLDEFLKDNLVRIRPPGRLTCYDTYAITLAGHLVEVVSGLTYEEYLQQHIFGPLGMERSFITVPEDLRADVAIGYEFPGEWLPQRWEHMNTDPASTVNSTVVDMSRLAAMLLEGGAYRDRRILSEESARAMMTQQFRNHADQPGYGYILTEDWNYGVPAFSHGGSMTGFGCFLYLVPDERLGLFVAYNQESGGLADSVIEATVRSMVPGKAVEPLSLARVKGVDLDRFLGTYASNLYNHSRPELGGWRRSPFDLTKGPGEALEFQDRLCFPVGELAFLSDDDLLLTFEEDEQGRITHLFVQQTVYEKLD